MAQSQNEIEDVMIRSLMDNDSDVRAEAAGALGNIGGVKSIVPLIQALSDDNNSVRKSALFALFRIGEPARAELIKVLGNNSSDSKQKRAAINALSEWSDNVWTFSSITEIAGLDIADSIAKNWSDGAKLVQIGLAESTKHCANDVCRLLFTGWSYIYESNGMYVSIIVNLSDYEANSGRLGEIDQISAWPFKYKQPLSREWAVTINDALKALSSNGHFSEQRGDYMSALYLDMGDLNSRITPLWHISIGKEDTNEVTSYLIDAKNGEIHADYG